MDAFAWGGGVDLPPLKSFFLLLKISIKCLVYSETKEFTKIFCEVFVRVSFKNLGHFSQYFFLNTEIFQIFLDNQILFFFQIQPFQAFLVSKTCICIHVKKKLHKIAMSANSLSGRVRKECKFLF